MTQRETGIEQRSDNTYVRKPKIVEKKPFNKWGTVFQDKDGDWLSSTQGRIYKDKFGNIATEEEYKDYLENTSNEFDRFTGRSIAKGLKNVYPEMALTGFARAGLTGALQSFKNSVTSTVTSTTSRQVKDNLLKGLEQATNVGGTINYEVRNAARSAVEKMDREVVKRLPERMQMPVSRTIKRGWNMATSSYGINGQIGTINDIKNK